MMDATLSEFQTLHSEAMDLAELAMLERSEGNHPRARTLNAEAFAKERQAAELIQDRTDLEPTRSVLLRSAASLALECGEAATARQLIERGLSGNPPMEIADELRVLLKTAQA
ncbi:MAG TPA: hypothetical protein VGK74_02545 [Symbiobacteriaceae bacterium]|jgi:hypothetical protein